MRRSKKIDALWGALPAASGKEIARRLTDQLGKLVSVHEALKLVSELRKNASTYGWTVPKVSHKGTGDIFVRVPLTPDGEFKMSEDIRHNVRLGAVASLLHIAQRVVNEAVALRALAEQMVQPPDAKSEPLAMQAKLQLVAPGAVARGRFRQFNCAKRRVPFLWISAAYACRTF